MGGAVDRVRWVAAGALVVAVLLACAAPAPAPATDDTTGAIYGQAEMSSTLSIAISGNGASTGSPLEFVGDPGDTDVTPVGGAYTVIANNGDTDISGLTIAAASVPTNGSSTWSYGDSAGATTCVWEFKVASASGWTALAASGSVALPLGTGALAAGNDTRLYSQFTFPTTYAGGTYRMSAIVTASE